LNEDEDEQNGSNRKKKTGILAAMKFAEELPKASSKPGQKLGLISDFFKGQREKGVTSRHIGEADKENSRIVEVPEKLGMMSLLDLENEKKSASSSARRMDLKRNTARGAFNLSNRKSGGKKLMPNSRSSSAKRRSSSVKRRSNGKMDEEGL